MQKIYISLLCCFIGLSFSVTYAADSSADLAESVGSMRAWHAAEGLPSDYVTAIIQTRDGFLWIGTTAGLARFDGLKFTKLELPVALSNNQTGITALCEDDNGHLWIGTQAGGLFELEQGNVHHYTVARGLLDNDITSLATDSHGGLWVGTKSGLNRWDGRRFKSFTTQDGLPDNLISGVHVARSGTVWITTRSGLCQFIDGQITPYAFQTESQGRSPEYIGAYEDRHTNLWAFGDTYLINLAEGKRFNYFRSSESASVRIWSLCEGRDGRLWIGTSGRGLFCFEDNSFQPVMLGENRWPYDVRAICEDRHGNLWLGTSGGGLLQLRPQSVHVLRAGQGLPEGTPTALAQDANGRIYVGMQRGGLFVGESGRFDRVDGNDGLSLQNFITATAVARDGTVWAGTLGNGLFALKGDHGLQFTTANGLADDVVLAVCADDDGNIWASTSAGMVHRFASNAVTRFDTTHGLPGGPVTTLISATGGGLWLGTRDGQILRENNDQFIHLKSLENVPVLALHEEAPEHLWIGTAGAGLTSWANGQVMTWSITNGLPDNIVAGVAEDRAKNLWLATGAGIYRVNHGNLRQALENPKVPLICELISTMKVTLGSGAVFGGTRALLSTNGGLWFATSDNVLNIDTHSSEIATAPIPLYLESATFNGGPPISLLQGDLWSKPSTNPAVFEAPGNVGSLDINFAALNFASPEEVHFRHKLDGNETDWVNNDSNSRQVHYSSLPYGKYRFRIAARNLAGVWQESPQSFTFIVPTPLALQTWAICLYVLGAVGLIAGIVRVVSHRRLRNALTRLEQLQALERERMRIARDMHDEMGSKLTKISFLSEHAQMNAGTGGALMNKKMQDIAQTSRDLLQTMDEIVWVVNPRNDSLDNLVTYLNHYATEYFQNTNVECVLRLPPEIPHHPVSSEARHNLFLTFEEALNNVLKHSGATRVTVEMRVSAAEFEIKITDNGHGFKAPDLPATNRAGGRRGGNGLNNMQQRLADIGGECLIVNRPEGGITVTMRFRLDKKITRTP